MHDGDIAILKGPEVLDVLDGRELEVIRTVRNAYETHRDGDSNLPHSTFLGFPDQPLDRIIALPAYLGGESPVAGVKWVSSFPENLQLGLDRASAVVILNSATTGRPEAVLEGSVISAKRTAASAALAAKCLRGDDEVSRIGLIGCGLINFEIARFLAAVFPEASSWVVFDREPARARQFEERCSTTFDRLDVEIADDLEGVIQSCRLVSIATTAVTPHISDLGGIPAGATILHISLRDLSPDLVLSCDNVVDDVDHVCRAGTSVHLAYQRVGHRGFIRCTLADLLAGRAEGKDPDAVTVFSPFGLGILDLAVGKLAHELALEQGLETVIPAFLPGPWTGRA